jgi:ribosomal protein L10
MSKPVKELIMRDYRDRLGDIEDVTVITLRGIDANRNNEIRTGPAKKDIRVTIVRNKLFLSAFEGSKLTNLEPVLRGRTRSPTAPSRSSRWPARSSRSPSSTRRSS